MTLVRRSRLAPTTGATTGASHHPRRRGSRTWLSTSYQPHRGLTPGNGELSVAPDPSASLSEVGSPASMPVKFSNGLKGSVMMTRCGESPEAVERAKEQLLEAAGYWVPPSEPNPAQPLVAPMRGARSATRPREHRS